MILAGLGLVVWIAAPHAVVPPQQITWTQAGIDPSLAQVFVYTLSIAEEGVAVPRVIGLFNVLCGGTAAASTCSAALPAAAQSAIVTGNRSTLTAKDTRTNLVSAPSAVFVGNQGCIFRDNLYALKAQAQAQTTKQGVQAVLSEFQRAKFKHVSTTGKGNNLVVTEECVGFLVQ